jgi:hypothetical protein
MPIDDCDDSNPITIYCKPNFAFNFTSVNINTIRLFNANDGVSGPSEKVTVTACEAAFYETSGYFHNNSVNLYKVTLSATGKGVLIDNKKPDGEKIFNAEQLTATQGHHVIKLIDNNSEALVIETITPFIDINNNSMLDVNDVTGDPIVITYNITIYKKWYKDIDGDKHAETVLGACATAAQLPGYTLTPLPVDDCDDSNPAITTCTPTFGFKLNDISLANINNGTTDAGEAATVTFCGNGNFSFSDFFSSGRSFVYFEDKINVNGGKIFIDNREVQQHLYYSFQNKIGTHSISLANSAVASTVTETITPYVDYDTSKSISAGDAVGEPVTITYVLRAKITWYKDADGDGHASSSTSSCDRPSAPWTMTPLPVDDCNDNDPTPCPDWQNVLPLSKSPIVDSKSNLLSTPLTLTLSPNPVAHTLNIYVDELIENNKSAISIISASGVVIKNIQSKTITRITKLNVSWLSAGMYFIKLVNGDKIVYKQFVKL